MVLTGLVTATSVASLKAQWSVTRDSAGVAIVENRSPNPQRTPMRLGSEPLVEIGDPEGHGGTDFTAILSGRLLPGGLIAVVDLRIPEVRIFREDSGELVRSVGRAGEGPGEFGAAPTIAVADAGSLWAWDPGNRRVSLFDLEGRLLEEHRLPPSLLREVPFSSTLNAWDLSSSGVVISLTEPARRPGLSERRIRLLNRAHRSPVLIGETHVTPSVMDGPYILADPFTSGLTGTVVDERVFLVRPGPWEVEVYDFQGRLVRAIRSRIPRTPISSEIRAAERRFLEQTYSHTPAFHRLFDELAPGDSTSAIGQVLGSRDGSVWVQRWRSRGQRPGRTYDVLDPEGRWDRTIHVPEEAGEVLDVCGSRVLTVFYDESFVPYVRVYELTRRLPP